MTSLDAPPRQPAPPAADPRLEGAGPLAAVLLVVAAVAVLVAAIATAPLPADVAEPAPAPPERLRSVTDVEDAQGWRTARLTGTAAAAFEPMRFTAGEGGMIAPDPAWVEAHIVTAEVPLLRGPVRCHRLLVEPLRGALGELEAAGLGHLVDPSEYGGCHVPRHILFDPDRNLSLHAWGVAVDFNVAGNGYGEEPTMDRRVVEVFERWGFTWGGHWRTPDGMHFELLDIVERS